VSYRSYPNQHPLKTNHLDWLIPGASTTATNPVYAYDLRRNRRKHTLATLIPFTIRWLSLVLVIVCGGWLFLVLASTQPTVITGASPAPAYSTSSDVIGLIIIGSIGCNLLLDLVAVMVAVGAINQQRTRRSWDLIRMTDLPKHTLLQAKHHLAQLYGWWMLVVVFGLRLAAILLIGIQAIVIPTNPFNNDTLLMEVSREFQREPAIVSLLLVTFMIVAIIYLAEAVWRYRALTQLGLWISARVFNVNVAIFASVSAIVAVWLSQGFLVFALYVVMFRILSGLQFSTAGVAVITSMMLVMLIGACIRLYYYVLAKGVRRATYRAI
jgi:hypothetical protein